MKVTFALASLLAGLAVAPPVSAAAPDTLKAAAAAKGRVFGTAVAAHRLGESDYTGTLDREFGQATAENEMKWDATEPSRGSFTFGNADRIAGHAQSQGMKVRGHTLVWHQQLPGWVNDVTSGSELLNVMRDHITGVAGHYRGKIAYWDVVNEAFEDGGSGARRNTIFQQRIGNSYIEEAFRAARLTDPVAKLCYNDYSTDGVNPKSTAVHTMVADFKRRGVPIDCVGVQAHLNAGQVPGDMRANLQRFADLGVDVHITELDISGSGTSQANDYAQVIKACLAVSRCTVIAVWGVTDKYSWRAGETPLLFDGNYNKKPAYHSVLETLGGSSRHIPVAVPITTASAVRCCRVPPETSTAPHAGESVFAHEPRRR